MHAGLKMAPYRLTLGCAAVCRWKDQSFGQQMLHALDAVFWQNVDSLIPPEERDYGDYEEKDEWYVRQQNSVTRQPLRDACAAPRHGLRSTLGGRRHPRTYSH